MDCYTYTTVEVGPGHTMSTGQAYTVREADIVRADPIPVVHEREYYAGEVMWTVDYDWSGVHVDRPNTGGIATGPGAKGRKLADRLAAATRAGRAFTDHRHITTDNAGQTYVCAHGTVMGKYLNADLKRIGF